MWTRLPPCVPYDFIFKSRRKGSRSGQKYNPRRDIQRGMNLMVNLLYLKTLWKKSQLGHSLYQEWVYWTTTYHVQQQTARSAWPTHSAKAMSSNHTINERNHCRDGYLTLSEGTSFCAGNNESLQAQTSQWICL